MSPAPPRRDTEANMTRQDQDRSASTGEWPHSTGCFRRVSSQDSGAIAAMEEVDRGARPVMAHVDGGARPAMAEVDGGDVAMAEPCGGDP